MFRAEICASAIGTSFGPRTYPRMLPVVVCPASALGTARDAINAAPTSVAARARVHADGVLVGVLVWGACRVRRRASVLTWLLMSTSSIRELRERVVDRQVGWTGEWGWGLARAALDVGTSSEGSSATSAPQERRMTRVVGNRSWRRTCVFLLSMALSRVSTPRMPSSEMAT